MRSTEAHHSRRTQRGATLIEALVASALLGIGVVAGLSAWDTAILSAQKGVRQAWARCVVRSELDAILAAPFDSSSYPAPPPQQTGSSTSSSVLVTVTNVRGNAGDIGEEQLVTVEALDRGTTLFKVSALKLRATQGAAIVDSRVLNDMTSGCPPP